MTGCRARSSAGSYDRGVAAAELLMWSVPVLGAAGVALSARPRWALRLLAVAAVAAWVAVAVLGEAMVSQRWEYRYVADHSRSGISAATRLGGLWAGPEGSLLVWTAMVTTVAWLIVRGAIRHVWTVRLAAMLAATYGLVVATQANPFARSPIPAIDGLGLQPVLEHPALLWHPPLLYAGLAGLLHPSVTAIGSRRRGVTSAPTGASLAVPLAFLAAGLLTGARWAYAEVGWGGYWAWDPIETAGLVAFCAGAAAMHGGLRHPAIWALPGVAAIWATTLTRVGLIESVHGFADRPGLRVALLVAAFAWTAALLGPAVRATGALGAPRRVFATTVLVGATIVGALGTYEPLLEAATTGDRVAIAGRYFSVALWPVVVTGLIGLVWIDQRRGGRALTAWATFAGAVVSVLVVPAASGPFGQMLAAAGGATVVSTLATGRRDWTRAAAHVGVGVLLIGVASTFATERATATLAVGERADVAGVTIEHRGIELDDGETPTVTATALVNGRVTEPSLVAYPLRGTTTSEIAHVVSGIDEIQVVLVDGTSELARYRVHHVPGVMLVWAGGALVAAALAAHSLRRLRASSWSTVEPASSDRSPPESVGDSAGGDGGAVGGTVGGPGTVAVAGGVGDVTVADPDSG